MFNRISNHQSDLIFLVVRVPRNWQPRNVFDIPMRGEIVSSMPVGSFEEAKEDLIRCNRFAIESVLRQWAVIQCAGEEV